MSEKMELLYWKPSSIMGISKGDNVFIDFSALRKNQGFIEFMGKEGAGKSAHLMGIAYNMGGELGLDKKRLFNSLDNDLNEELVGSKGGEKYKVEVSAARISVKKEMLNGKWVDPNEDTPAAMVKKLFGSVGIFPTGVQEMKGRQQIEKFYELFGSGEGAGKKAQKLEAEYDNKFIDRRDINRDIKLLVGALEVEPLYQNREASEQRFAVPINAEKEKARFDELSDKKNKYEKYQNTVAIAKADLKDRDGAISELEERVAKLKMEREAVANTFETGKKWLEDKKPILKEYEDANKAWLNLSDTMSEQNKWKDILKKERELTDKQEQSVTLTGDLDELNEKILKATNECLPKVKGLTAKVVTGIDKKDKPEGMFYLVPGKKQEQPIHELSETEYADMWCKIWEEEGVQFIFIENLSSYGESMIKTLNQFAKNGGYVFYTLQNRAQKELSVSFKTKVE